MASRQSKRSGFGVQRGALNPRVHVGDIAPSSPQSKDVWVDSFNNKAFRWSGSAWVEFAGIGPIKIWTGTETAYTAIATPDDSTLYFCTNA